MSEKASGTVSGSTHSILAFLDLIRHEGAVVEMRVLDADRVGTLSGYFNADSLDIAVAAALEWSGKAGGVYGTLNPVTPDAMPRAANHLEPRPRHTTKDDEIVRRRWVPIDIDPVRPAGISSTDEQHEAARAKALEIRDGLAERGFTAPVQIDTGNGALLLYRVDEPNNVPTTVMMKKVLQAVAVIFNDDRVHVDEGVFNAARLVRIPGTLNRKGDATPDRPHRLARIIDQPAELVPVQRKLLEELAALVPQRPPRARGHDNGDDVEAFINQHPDLVTVLHRGPWNGHERLVIHCPFNSAHKNKSAFIIKFSDGGVCARCHHASCHGKGWPDIKALVEDGSEPKLPEIDAGDLNLPRITRATWRAILSANIPPYLFRSGTVLSRLEHGDEHLPALRPLDTYRLRHELARVAEWCRFTRFGPEPALPPLHVVHDILADAAPQLPPLTRIVAAPVFAADGTLLQTPGYQAPAAIYYAPADGLDVPAVPETPSRSDIDHARELLLDDLLADFPFTGDAERAHAVALMVLPFAREMIDGRTPLHLIEKPAPGTGGGLLLQVLTMPALGHAPAVMTEGRDEDEWRKRLTAKFVTGSIFLVIDNIRRRLDSGALAAAITAPVWEDRLLGQTQMVRVRPRCAWVAIGNNPALSNEMARRSARIRLDAKRDQPWLRDEFKHPNLRLWALEHRGDLIAAVLTIIRAWIAAGRPKGTRTLGEFESWAQVIGGILDVAEIPGFLGNLYEFYEASDAEGAQVRALLAAWWDQYRDTEVGVQQVFTIATSDGVALELDAATEQGRRTKLGQLLAGPLRDRRYKLSADLEVQVTRAGQRQRATKWRLLPHGGAPPAPIMLAANEPPTRATVNEAAVVATATPAARPRPSAPCGKCGGRKFWTTTYGVTTCAACSPPLASFTTEVFDLPAPVDDEGAGR
jgi:hypothetical protein